MRRELIRGWGDLLGEGQGDLIRGWELGNLSVGVKEHYHGSEGVLSRGDGKTSFIKGDREYLYY